MAEIGQQTAAERRFQRDAVYLAARELAFAALSKHFPTATLSDIVDFFSGYAWSASAFSPGPSGIPIIRIQNLGDDGSKEFVFWEGEYDERFLTRAGDLLLSMSGSFKVCRWSGPDALLNQRIVKLLPKNDLLDLDFLLYATDAIVEHIANAATQTSVKNVSLKSMAAFCIPLPPRVVQENVSRFLASVKSRKQQVDWPKPVDVLKPIHSTVARIEALAAQIHEARTLRNQAAEEAEALILSALTHLRLPHGTKSKPIAECSTMSTGTTPPSERSDFYGGPIQWYTPGDLEYQQQLGASSRTLSELALAERKARMFESGTVLLVAIGGSLGKVALTHERCSANQQITGIKFANEILPEFGFWWMRGLGKKLMASAPQATLPIINQERIGAFEISVPPLAEQRRIVAEMDALQVEVDALKRLQAEIAAELDALAVHSRWAFKGEL